MYAGNNSYYHVLLHETIAHMDLVYFKGNDCNALKVSSDTEGRKRSCYAATADIACRNHFAATEV